MQKMADKIGESLNPLQANPLNQDDPDMKPEVSDIESVVSEIAKLSHIVFLTGFSNY